MRIAPWSAMSAVLLLASCGTPKQVREPDEDEEETADTTAPETKPRPPEVTPGKRPPRPAEGVAAALGPERVLDAEAAVTTAWDATIPVPAGWVVAEGPDLVKLQDPDRQITIAVAAIEGVDNANVAITVAWKLLDPSFQMAVAQSVDTPGRDGWDAQTQARYVTSAEESRLVVALARKKNDVWHVVLLDGKLAAVGRRGAQTSSIANDLKVPGLEIESYADNTATVDKEHLKRFAEAVEAARAQAGVPGVAVAVVHGGKTVFERGFGVQSLYTRKPVTGSTRFLIGPATEPLTSLLVARLVDQGKLAWDGPLTGVLPAFALGDPDATAQVQVQHTLCNCTGVPNQDTESLFEFAGADLGSRVASLATLSPTTGFGETFQESDLMFAAGGEAAGLVFAPKEKPAAAYEKAMKKLVLGPLKMRHTTFGLAKAGGRGYAAPNARGLNQTFVELPVAYEGPSASVAPAAGAWSTVGDLARYVQLELAKGKQGRKALVGEAALLARRAAQVKIDAENAYGLGLMITNDHGVMVLHRGGSTLGFTSDVFMLPEHDVGVVVLANAGDVEAFRAAVRQAFLEIVFDGRPVAKEQLTAALGVSRTAALRESMQLTQVEPSFIEPLLGTYAAPGLGTISIEQKPGGYQLDAGEWATALARKSSKGKAAALVATTPPFLGLELVPTGDGSLVLEAGGQSYTFTRGAAPAAPARVMAPPPATMEPDEPAPDEEPAPDGGGDDEPDDSGDE